MATVSKNITPFYTIGLVFFNTDGPHNFFPIKKKSKFATWKTLRGARRALDRIGGQTDDHRKLHIVKISDENGNWEAVTNA